MKTSFIAAISLAAALALSGNSEAAERGAYLGASVGKARTKFARNSAASSSDVFRGKDDAFKLTAGFRAFDWLGIEGSYLDLGEVEQVVDFTDFSGFSQEQRAFAAFAVFYHEMANVDLFAKAGVVKWNADGSFSGVAGPTDANEKDTEGAWGLGLQGRLGSFALRLEYEHLGFETLGEQIRKPRLVSVGFTWAL